MPYEQTKNDFDKLAEIAPFWSGALIACVRDGLDTAQTRNVLVKCAKSDPVLLDEFNEIAARLSSGAGLLKQAESWDQYWQRTQDWKPEPGQQLAPPQRAVYQSLDQPDASDKTRAKWERAALNLLTPQEQHVRSLRIGDSWEILERAVRAGRTPYGQKAWEATPEGQRPAPIPDPDWRPSPTLDEFAAEEGVGPDFWADNEEWAYAARAKQIAKEQAIQEERRVASYERHIDFNQQQQREYDHQQIFGKQPYRKYKGTGAWQIATRPLDMLGSAGTGFVDTAGGIGSTLGGLTFSLPSLVEKAWGGRAMADLRDDYFGNAGAQFTSGGESVANIFTLGEYNNSIADTGTNAAQRNMDAVARRNLKHKTGYGEGDFFWQKEFWEDDWLAGFDRFQRGGSILAAEFAVPGALLKGVNKLRGVPIIAGTLTEARGITLLDDAIKAVTTSSNFVDDAGNVSKALTRFSDSARKAALSGNAAGATKRIELAIKYMERIGATTKQVNKFKQAALLATEHAAGMNVLNTTVKALRKSGDISDEALLNWGKLSETQRATQAAYPTLAKFQQIKSVPLIGRVPGVNQLLQAGQSTLAHLPGAGLGQTSRGSHVLRNLDRAQIIKNSPFFRRMIGLEQGVFSGGGYSNARHTIIPGVRDLGRQGARMTGVPGLVEQSSWLFGNKADQAADFMSKALNSVAAKRMPVLHHVDDIVFGHLRNGYKTGLRYISSSSGSKGSGSFATNVIGLAAEPLITDPVVGRIHTNPIWNNPRRNEDLGDSGLNPSSSNYVDQPPGLTPYAKHARVAFARRQVYYNNNAGEHTRTVMNFALPPDHFRLALERHVEVNTGFTPDEGASEFQALSPEQWNRPTEQPADLFKRNPNIPIGGHTGTYMRPKHSLLATAQWNVADEYEATNILLHPMNSTMEGVFSAYQQAGFAYRTLSTAQGPQPVPQSQQQALGLNRPSGTGIINAQRTEGTTAGPIVSALSQMLPGSDRLTVKENDPVAAQHFVDQVVNPVHDRIVNQSMYQYYNQWLRNWNIAAGTPGAPAQYLLSDRENMFSTMSVKGKETYLVPEDIQKAAFNPETHMQGHALQYHIATMNARYQIYEMHVNKIVPLPTVAQGMLLDTRRKPWWSTAQKFYDNVQADWHAKMEETKPIFPHMSDNQVEGWLIENGGFREIFADNMPEMEYIMHKGKVILRPEASNEVEQNWEQNPAPSAAPAAAPVPTAAPVPMPEGLPGLPM